ncbi:Holliday junction branch migration protein RuvA [Calderihabitans maritimus]|uniref:Holliday junction branch migration complex subunit RuvA n=1 Tax=Calderihabitans maritimus TaxID=1246530 RepID=A0A1Z5HT65_9FIRM|nr:Holliday junction branch migration protein RuvA [Calderihabitans maritimus]GAW92722.1 Holliday junction DNA helicase RuvA [Calderihabitans maritimus]
MIAYLRGNLQDKAADNIVVEVGGIGYQVIVPAGVLAKLPPPGQSVMVHTYLHVREDGLQLFGFLDLGELELFKTLLSVSGMGPKNAIAALSTMPAEQIRQAIITENVNALTNIPGIGKKTAQRLILELKDKLGKQLKEEVLVSTAQGETSALNDALEALIQLGYSPQEIQGLLRKGLKELGQNVQANDLVRFVLKQLGRS